MEIEQASIKHTGKSEEGWIRHFIRATGVERLSRHPTPSRLNLSVRCQTSLSVL